MNKNELPSSVPLDNALLFRDDVPPVVLRTFARLYALAWKHHYDRTDRLTTDDLLPILDLSMRQMYDHIAKLRRLGVLEWTSDGQYGYIFTFPKNSGAFVPDDALQDAAVSAWVAAPATASLQPEPASAEIRSWQSSAPAATAGHPHGESTAAAAEIRSWGSATPAPTAENRSPAAEIRSWNTPEPTPVAAAAPDPTAENRSPAAEIRSWDLIEPAPTAETRTPAAEIRSWDLAVSVSTAENRTPTAENRSPGAENRSPAAEIRSQRPSVVVVDNNTPDLDLNKQQQQQGVSSPAPTAENRSPGAEIRTWPELVAVLIAAGMWNDLAAGLTAGLDVNGVLDALGWIAAVRADRRVHNHGAVLVKQLQAGRHAPADWRPPAVCAACGVADYRCTCGANDWMVPAVYYTAAIEPLTEWGRDRWGVCEVCGRVTCDCHDRGAEDAVAGEVAYAAAPNGAGVDLREAQIRQAWENVAQVMRVRYATSVDLVGVVGNQAQIAFAGKDRHQTLNLVQTNLYRQLRRDVEVIDAGPA